MAVIFGIAQVRAAARDRRERLTLDMLRNFQTREFCELLHRVNRYPLPQTAAEMRGLSDADSVSSIQLAQTMESLSLLVAEKLIDIDLVDKTLGSFVTSAWDKYRPVFFDMRVRNPDPFLGEYFSGLPKPSIAGCGTIRECLFMRLSRSDNGFPVAADGAILR